MSATHLLNCSIPPDLYDCFVMFCHLREASNICWLFLYQVWCILRCNCIIFHRWMIFIHRSPSHRRHPSHRFAKLLDSVIHFIVPVWEYSLGSFRSCLDMVRQFLPLSKKRMSLIQHFLIQSEAGYVTKLVNYYRIIWKSIKGEGKYKQTLCRSVSPQKQKLLQQPQKQKLLP